MADTVSEQLSKVKRINPERIQKLAKFTTDDIRKMSDSELSALAKQCDADYIRLTEAAEQLMAASGLIINVGVDARDVMIERRLPF